MTDAERAWKRYVDQNKIIEGIRTVNEQAAFEWGYGEGFAATEQRIAERIAELKAEAADVPRLKLRLDSQDRLIADQVRSIEVAERERDEAHSDLAAVTLHLASEQNYREAAESELEEAHEEIDALVRTKFDLTETIEKLEAEVESLRNDWNAAADMAEVRAEMAEVRAEAAEARLAAATRNALEMAAQYLVEVADRLVPPPLHPTPTRDRHTAYVLREQANKIRALSDQEAQP